MMRVNLKSAMTFWARGIKIAKMLLQNISYAGMGLASRKNHDFNQIIMGRVPHEDVRYYDSELTFWLLASMTFWEDTS